MDVEEAVETLKSGRLVNIQNSIIEVLMALEEKDKENAALRSKGGERAT